MSLKEQKLSNSFIKAALESAISKLPEGTVSYTSYSIKKSTFENLVNYLKKKIGDFEFEQIAGTPSSTISDFDLETNLFNIKEVLRPSEINHFAKTFLKPREFEEYQGRSEVWDAVLGILITRHCRMSVNEFLSKLNPDFPDLASLSLSD